MCTPEEAVADTASEEEVLVEEREAVETMKQPKVTILHSSTIYWQWDTYTYTYTHARTVHHMVNS